MNKSYLAITTFIFFSITLIIVIHNSLFINFVYDDFFYYFQTAENLVNDGIFSFDGKNITNGFQPFFLLFCALLITLFKGAALKLAFLSLFLFHFASFLVLFKIIKHIAHKKPAYILSTFFLFNPAAFHKILNGFETPVFLFFSLMFVYFFFIKRSKIYILFLILAFLTRYDFWIFIFAIGAAFLIRKNYKKTAVFIAAALGLLAAYFLINFLTAKSAMQTSAYAFYFIKRTLILEQNLSFSYEFIKHLFINIFNFVTLTFLLPAFRSKILFFLSAVVFGLFLLKIKSGKFLFLVLKIFACLLILIMSFHFSITQRYMVFASTLFLIFFGVLLKKKLKVLTLILSLIFIINLTVFQKHRGMTAAKAEFLNSFDATSLLDEDVKIGAFGAGYYGYVFPGKVVNLDGVINSPEYFSYLKNKEFISYLRKENIKYIIGYKTLPQIFFKYFNEPSLNLEDLIFKKIMINKRDFYIYKVPL